MRLEHRARLRAERVEEEHELVAAPLEEQLREQIKFKVEKNFEGAVPFGLVEMLRVKSLRLAVEANGTAAEMVSACLMI